MIFNVSLCFCAIDYISSVVVPLAVPKIVILYLPHSVTIEDLEQ